MNLKGSPKKGTELLVKHVRALDNLHDRRPPLTRLTDVLGVRLATILVSALTGDHTARRSDLVA